jgi:hypothetical protein
VAVFIDRSSTNDTSGAQDEGGTGKAVAEASDSAVVAAQARYYIAAALLIALGVGSGLLILDKRTPDPSSLPMLAPGVGVFAVLYIYAQVIERLLEPFSSLFGSALGGLAKAKKELVEDRNKKVATAKNSPSPGSQKAAANAQQLVSQCRSNAATLSVGIATFLACSAAGYSGFLILHLAGLAKTDAWVDLLVTGLAIGGGTKPLHDLITSITESKSSKQDPAEVQN